MNEDTDSIAPMHICTGLYDTIPIVVVSFTYKVFRRKRHVNRQTMWSRTVTTSQRAKQNELITRYTNQLYEKHSLFFREGTSDRDLALFWPVSKRDGRGGDVYERGKTRKANVIWKYPQ